MAEGDTIEVFTENVLASGLNCPDPVPPAPKSCQLIPPCREGNHGVQPSVDTAYRKIGKYYFTEKALKHDLAALKRGKVYTKQEFFRRARAWYKADIDRILHWHRVYKERNPEKPKEVHVINPKPKSEVIEETIAKNEETVKDQTQLVQDEKKEEEKQKEGQQKETEPRTQEPKLKTRAKKVKVPVAPTRVQPARAAKRKAIEPQLPKRTAKKKKRFEDSIEAVAPTLEPAETIHVNAEEPAEKREETPWTGEQRPNGTQERPKLQDPSKLQNLEPSQPDEHVEETKGDYQLNLDEWKVFLARYNSATTPVTPTPSPTSLSSFTLQQLQGLDIASFVLRLERIVETKINQLIDERQGITIDAGAGGGLCLTGYYHHPYKCALDGNYVPPLKFEAASGYVPGEDWRPKEAQKEDGTGAGEVGGHSDEKKAEQIGEKQDMVESTTGVVSSPRYRPPQTGRRLAERILSSANTSRGVSPFPTRQEASAADPAGIPIPGLEAALHRQAQAAAAGDDQDSEAAGNPNRNEPFQPAQPIQTLPHPPKLPALSSREEDDASRSTSMRNSPAPEALMDISPTLGRWRPPIPGLPLENFDDAIVDFAGLRFAVDLCAGYLGDGRSARMFML
ncbi:hypothetical protein V8F33_009589 [Rhypophila sp. PSN 637]